eukprot:745160_1
MSFFFLIVCCGVNNCIISRQKKKWNDRLCHIENYIDHELNPHYEPSHVVWQITPKFVTYGPNNGKYDFSHKIRYYNIKIYPESLAPVTVTVPTMDEEIVALKEEIDTFKDEHDSEGIADTKINLTMNDQKETQSLLLEDGHYKFEWDGKMIEVSDNSKNIGAVLQISDEIESDNQIFYVEKIYGDYYTIQCKHSGLYWNFVGGAKDNNRKVVQWNYHGLENQQFKFVNKNEQTFNIIARHSDKALSVENGSKIVQYDVNHGSEQIFHCQRWCS